MQRDMLWNLQILSIWGGDKLFVLYKNILISLKPGDALDNM